MSGIELVSKERQEQIDRHGWDDEHDSQHVLGELKNAAIYVLTGDEHYFPEDWDLKYKAKFDSKGYKERLIVAAALLVAELDRIEEQTKE